MVVTILNTRPIQTRKDPETGKETYWRSVLIDHGDGMHADWKYIPDEVYDPKALVKGMKCDMLFNERGFVTYLAPTK